MTLQELKAKLPDGMQPWVDQYGPVFLAMAADEVKRWIEMVIQGDMEAAYEAVIRAMEQDSAIGNLAALDARWAAKNKANADAVALGKTAFAKMMEILLTIALAMVGL